MKRIYHDYRKWEDFQNGMFSIGIDQDKLDQCIILLSDENLLLIAMRKASNNWVFAAEVNLSNRSRNRQAWLGQAACCITHGASEETTRQAWNMLDEKTKEKANGIADLVIKEWENKHEDI